MKVLVRVASSFGFLALVACASNSPPPPSSADQPASGVDPTAVPPEKIDEIQAIFREKGVLVRRCYEDEMRRQGKKPLEAPEARFMVSVHIEPDGKATTVTITENTLQTPEFEQCLKETIASFSFPTLPGPVDTSWPYAFKPL